MEAPSTSVTIEHPSVAPKHDVRVVVVDHRHDRRMLMGYVIRLGGDDVEIVGYADDAKGAVEAVDRFDANAVVLEIQLPVAQGLEAVAVIRSGHPDLRIVVCSFHADQKTRAAAIAAGADGYLAKPASPREIYPLLLPIPTNCVPDGVRD